MKRPILRSPDARFENLPGFDFELHYFEIEGRRIHYLDEGPSTARPFLLLHGEPSWSNPTSRSRAPGTSSSRTRAKSWPHGS